MNRITATLVQLEHENGVTLLEAQASGHMFSAMLVGDHPDISPGSAISLVFKETEVAIARNLAGQISLRNRVPTRINSVESGKLLSRIEMDFAGTPVYAVITTGSAQRMGLQAGAEVEWLVKANEMGIEC